MNRCIHFTIPRFSYLYRNYTNKYTYETKTHIYHMLYRFAYYLAKVMARLTCTRPACKVHVTELSHGWGQEGNKNKRKMAPKRTNNANTQRLAKKRKTSSQYIIYIYIYLSISLSLCMLYIYIYISYYILYIIYCILYINVYR